MVFSLLCTIAIVVSMSCCAIWHLVGGIAPSPLNPPVIILTFDIHVLIFRFTKKIDFVNLNIKTQSFSGRIWMVDFLGGCKSAWDGRLWPPYPQIRPWSFLRLVFTFDIRIFGCKASAACPKFPECEYQNAVIFRG